MVSDIPPLAGRLERVQWGNPRRQGLKISLAIRYLIPPPKDSVPCCRGSVYLSTCNVWGRDYSSEGPRPSQQKESNLLAFCSSRPAISLEI
jgi:hypothetical protein